MENINEKHLLSNEGEEKEKLQSLKNERFSKTLARYNKFYPAEYGWEPYEEQPFVSYVVSKETSSGEKVDIEVRGYRQATEKRLFFEAIQTNSSSEIVADMQVFFAGVKTLDRRVTVSEKFRGQSYSTPINEVGDELMIKFKNEYGVLRIQEKIENDNFLTLSKYIKDTLTGSKKYNEEKLKVLIDEQARWQNAFQKRYENHEKIKITGKNEIELPDVVSILSSLESENLVTEEALMRAVAIEGMIRDSFGDNTTKLTTGLIIAPK